MYHLKFSLQGIINLPPSLAEDLVKTADILPSFVELDVLKNE